MTHRQASRKMFSDKELNEYLASKGYQFSSANSINIGRLVPQMVYYVYAYTRLVANGEIKLATRSMSLFQPETSEIS